ncbi:MAG: IPT/TIG domain-containing protein [Aliidongia sp.]
MARLFLTVLLMSCGLAAPMAEAQTVTTLSPTFSGPSGITVDSSGNIFVSDTTNALVKELLAPDYTTVLTLGGTDASVIGQPEGLALDSSGNLFVVDEANNDTGNPQIEEIPGPSYNSVTTLAVGGFTNPFGIAIDSSGNLFVPDEGSNAVYEVTAPSYATATPVAIVNGNFTQPGGVALDSSDNLFVADSGDNLIKEVTASSGYTTVSTLAVGTTFNFPNGIAVEPGGDLIVVNDEDPGVINRILAPGYSTVQTIAASTGNFNNPNYVALDSTGNVFVTDTGNSRVKEILLSVTVGGVSPTSGPTAGGTSVTITGTNFDSSATVKFGNGSATGVSFVSATEVTATSPAGTGTVDVRVSTGAGTSATMANDHFTYLTAPTVSSVSPSSGPTAGGNSVTITGTNLAGATAVTFGAAAATITGNTATQITATAPAGSAGTVDVTVTTANGTSTTGTSDHYTYVAPPTVSGISPSAGSTIGGTAVTITGTNFTGATAVTIGGTAATGVTVVSAISITAVTPGGTAGAASVLVTTVGGTNAANSLYTYVAPPTVSAISPSAGPTTGGTPVTITGTGFTGATAVTIGGTAATGVTVVSATSITATTPAGSAGTASVLVTTAGGTNAANSLYTYVTPPTVSAIAPSAGPTTGGTAVTITGTNLTGATAVTIGGTAATTVTVVSATSITAVTPAGTAGTASVLVTTAGGTNAANSLYTYVTPPTVSAIAPNAGPTTGGTAVTITGTNLTGATAVTIGGTAATTVTVVSATSITAVTPAGSAGTASVLVTTAGGTNAANSLYTYVTPPTVSAIAPSAGPTTGGTAVTITGTNLTGATAVTIGGAAATGITVISATSITATTPAGSAGTASVLVTTVGGTNAANSLYTYVTPPTVSAIAPNAGPTAGGTAVTITGTNLTGATAVTIGGAAATGITVVSATSITATTPAGTAGTASVLVTTAGGTNAANALYTYAAPPTVSAIAPNAGPTAGGTAVTITGTNLTGATAVTIGGTAATGVTVVSATSITATTPAGTAGTASVLVTTAGGTNAANSLYTYAAPPTVSALSPATGPASGGTTVTITGSNLTAASTVAFGATAATNVVVVSATQITAMAPVGSPGIVDVTVTTPGGTSATGAADRYTYVAVPVVSSLSPSNGPAAGGTSVVITGSDLRGATAVKFGATAAASFTVNSATQITAVSPPEASGTVDITVATIGGTSATGAGDRYTFIGKTSIAVTSSANPSSSGEAVTFTAVVSAPGGAPTGTVVFRDGATTLFTGTLTGQISSYTTSTLTVGSHAISVTYAGTGPFTASSGGLTQVVVTAWAAPVPGQTYTYQATLGTPGVTTPDNSHFNAPAAGVYDPVNGHILIADAGNQRVQVLNAQTLAVVATLGTPGVAGSDNAHFDDPTGVSFDPGSDEIFVADTGNDRIQVFDAKSFAYVATLGASGAGNAKLAAAGNTGFDAPGGLQSDAATGRLYVADTGNQRVQIFDSATSAYVATLGTAGSAGSDNAHFNAPKDVVVNAAANEILVADSGNSRVQRFDAASFAYKGTIGGAGRNQGDPEFLAAPVALAYDAGNNLVLIADSAEQRVQVFDAFSYTYVLTLGTTGAAGTGNGQFSGPAGVAIDPTEGRIFVGDQKNDRVQVFSIAPTTAFASVLPGSRSVQLGKPATIFASVINAGTTALSGCQVALPVTAPSGLSLSYQTTNPATNALIGTPDTPDTPATIAANNGVQSFLVTFQGTSAFSAPGMALDFDCLGIGPAAVVTGVDTVDLVMSSTPVADVIALAATASNDGIAQIPLDGAGAFAVASSNVGASAQIVVSVDTGSATLPLTATICQSNPSTGACLATPASTVTLAFAAQAAPTFSVFLQSSGAIPFDPGASRIFVRFKDAAGGIHGSTSVAVETK